MFVLLCSARVVLIFYDEKTRISSSVHHIFLLTPSVLYFNKRQLLMTSLNLSLWYAASKTQLLNYTVFPPLKTLSEMFQSKKIYCVVILLYNSLWKWEHSAKLLRVMFHCLSKPYNKPSSALHIIKL